MFSVLRKISAFAGSRRGLLKKSMLVAFLGAVFTAFQFWALMLTLEILVAGASLSIWPVIGVMLVSVAGRTACSYWSTNAETETGYFMVAEKRIHIGDRLRYIPMGYFNDNSLGNITAVVTTTLSDVENNAARPTTDTIITPMTGQMRRSTPPTRISRVSIRAANWRAANTAPRKATAMDFFKSPRRVPAKSEIFFRTLNTAHSSFPSRVPR